MVLRASVHSAVASSAVVMGRHSGTVLVTCGEMHATAASYAAVRAASLSGPSSCTHPCPTYSRSIELLSVITRALAFPCPFPFRCKERYQGCQNVHYCPQQHPGLTLRGVVSKMLHPEGSLCQELDPQLY